MVWQDIWQNIYMIYQIEFKIAMDKNHFAIIKFLYSILALLEFSTISYLKL